jgi:hypothetical protein
MRATFLMNLLQVDGGLMGIEGAMEGLTQLRYNRSIDSSVLNGGRKAPAI